MTMLVIGPDGSERDRLKRTFRDVFGWRRVYAAANAREALTLLDEMLIDCVVAVRADDDGAWASFVRRWMGTKPGLCNIPFAVASDRDDLRALSRSLEARLLAPVDGRA